MKFITLIAAAFLPLATLAAPFADGETDAFILKDRDISVDDSNGAGIFSRAAQNCKIIGDSATVNCRSGASTSSDAVYTVRKGDTYKFTCVKTGECVTIGGKTNW
jgi:uncharacterized protein YgiM (DUF1202 family)